MMIFNSKWFSFYSEKLENEIFLMSVNNDDKQEELENSLDMAKRVNSDLEKKVKELAKQRYLS